MERDDDEAEERRRLEAERKKMRPVDRVYDRLPKRTVMGDVSGHASRRTGRLFPSLFRMTLTTRAMLKALKKRDDIPSDPIFLELLIEAYLKNNPDPPLIIPSEEELIEQYEREKERRDDK